MIKHLTGLDSMDGIINSGLSRVYKEGKPVLHESDKNQFLTSIVPNNVSLYIPVFDGNGNVERYMLVGITPDDILKLAKQIQDIKDIPAEYRYYDDLPF